MAVYTVRKGDTLTAIARRLNTTVAAIRALNPVVTNPDLIFVGQSLNLPGEGTVPVGAVSRRHSRGQQPWFDVAERELGEVEIRGRKSNPRILEYHATCTLRATNDDVHWCSAFVNWCMIQSGRTGTNSAAARSWLQWEGGERLDEPAKGCITVFSRGSNAAFGHVGFFTDRKGSKLLILGGNQSNRVSIAGFPASRALAHIMPT